MGNIVLITLDSFRCRLYKGKVGEKSKKVFSWDECAERYLKIYREVVCK